MDGFWAPGLGVSLVDGVVDRARKAGRLRLGVVARSALGVGGEPGCLVVATDPTSRAQLAQLLRAQGFVLHLVGRGGAIGAPAGRADATRADRIARLNAHIAAAEDPTTLLELLRADGAPRTAVIVERILRDTGTITDG